MLTTRIHAVNPRDYFMDYLRDEPQFQFHKRKHLTRFSLEDGPFRTAVIRRDLNALGVDVVCFDPSKQRRIKWVGRLGYENAYQSSSYVCLKR